jgi:type IV pilus biogenesis/stability protein PilW
MQIKRVFKAAAALTLLLLGACAHFGISGADQEKSKVYLQLAADQLMQRDYNKAIDSCYEAIKYDPSSAAAYNSLALVFMETKRFQKSEETFKKAMALKDDYPEVLNNYGVLLNREERYHEAIPIFQKALSFERYTTPENAMTNMGYSYFKMGDYAHARLFHQKALDVMPQFCLASKNMGDVYAKEKNFHKAADYFERAITNCPLYEESEYKLGLALMRLGQKTGARAQLEKLIKKHRNGPYVERSTEVLKYLQ